MQAATGTQRVAIFAYGSLMFRPGFAYSERVRGTLAGYQRSFSQASPDHRGTPERPGRVVTLLPESTALTVGVVYFVSAPAEELLRELDERERAGYERVSIEVALPTENVRALTWMAPAGNAYDVGQLAPDLLAAQIRLSVGPSGRNDDYVFRLESALAELGAVDPVVSELCRLLRL